MGLRGRLLGWDGRGMAGRKHYGFCREGEVGRGRGEGVIVLGH